MAFASICLILSLVTPKTFPISSNVFGLSSSNPNLILKTYCSCSLSPVSNSSIFSLRLCCSTSCITTSAKFASDGINSTKLLSSSSFIGVSNDTIFLSLFNISITFSTSRSHTSASYSREGSLCKTLESYCFFLFTKLIL